MPDSLYRQALDQVVTVIQGLALSSLENAEIRVGKFTWDNEYTNRGITVEPGDEIEGRGTNLRDDIGYPCVVTMVTGTSREWAQNVTLVTGWRQAIRRAFHEKRITIATLDQSNRIICKVLHAPFKVPDQYREHWDAGRLIVWVWFREQRT